MHEIGDRSDTIGAVSWRESTCAKKLITCDTWRVIWLPWEILALGGAMPWLVWTGGNLNPEEMPSIYLGDKTVVL